MDEDDDDDEDEEEDEEDDDDDDVSLFLKGPYYQRPFSPLHDAVCGCSRYLPTIC